MHLTRRFATSAMIAAASTMVRPLLPPALAWCGAPFPPYAYSLPWYEFPVGEGNAAAMRVVGDAVVEKQKRLNPLLVLAPPGLTYEYLEPLEALTISERRVAFAAFFPSKTRTLDEVAAAAAAAAEKLEAKKVHVLAHGTAAAAALALQARQPTLVASLILASPLSSLEDADASQRAALSNSPAPLLRSSAADADGKPVARACVDAELSGLQSRPATATAQAFGTLALRDRLLPPLSSTLAGVPADVADGTPAAQSGARDLLSSAAASHVPMLVTRGSNDVSSEQTAARLLERVPGARLQSFAGSASLAHVDQRASYNAAVLEFLDEVDGVSTRRAVMMPGSMAPGGSIKDA